MKITKDIVDYLSALARIEFSEEEKGLLSSQLEDILKYFETLNKLDTKNTPPTSHVVSIKNVFREDIQKGSLPSEEVLKNAPGRQDNYFKVPRIV